jgi:hypothetical protein
MRFTGRVGWGACFLVLMLAAAAHAQAPEATPTTFLRKRCCPPGYRPATSQHFSLYRDPCTGRTRVVVQRVTCCRPRRCGPVRRFFNRLFGRRCTCPACCPAPCPPTSALTAIPPLPSAGVQPPPLTAPPPTPPPSIPSSPAPPAENFNRTVPPVTLPPPPAGSEGSSLRFRRPRQPAPRLTPPLPPRPIALDRLASLQKGQGLVRGQVLRNDGTPSRAAHVLLVRADQSATRRSLTTDSSGRFSVQLPGGKWLIYLQEPGGTPAFHGYVQVGDQQMRNVSFVSR